MSYQNNTVIQGRFDYCAAEIVPGFTIDDSNRKVIDLLCQYLTADAAFETNGNMLGRGLFLAGTVGSGKTDLMRIVQRYFWYAKDARQFAFMSMIDYSRQYAKTEGGEGDVLDRFRNRHLFLDEFGMIDEKTGLRKYELITSYGTKLDLGEMVILSRYNEFKKGYLTHLTTNLTLSELEQQYDSRTVSRIREMCNIIPVVGPDRRPLAKPRLQVQPPKPEETGNVMQLLPLIQQIYPEQAKQLKNTIEHIAAKQSITTAKEKPKPKPESTYESWMVRFKESLPEIEGDELSKLLKEAELKQSHEIAAVIRSEFQRRMEAEEAVNQVTNV